MRLYVLLKFFKMYGGYLTTCYAVRFSLVLMFVIVSKQNKWVSYLSVMKSH